MTEKMERPGGFSSRFRVFQKVNIAVGVLIGLCFALLKTRIEVIFQDNLVLMGLWAGFGLAGAIVGGGIFLWFLAGRIILRCPACRRYPGTSLTPAFCCRCGAKLQ